MNYYKLIRIMLPAVLSLSILMSCRGRQESTKVECEDLKGSVIMPDTGFYYCFRPFMMGDRFITTVNNRAEGAYMGEIDGDSLRSIAYFTRIGQGPKEFVEMELTPGPDSTLYAMNGSFGYPISVIRIPFHPIPKADMSDWEEFRIDSLKFISGVPWVVISDSTALVNSSTFESDNLFSILDFKNSTVKEIPWTPDDGVKMDNLHAKQMVYSNNAHLFRNGDRLFFMSGAGAYACIFTLDGEGIKIEKTLYEIYPEYELAPDGLNHSIKGNTIRKDAAASAENIYILDFDRDMNGEIPEDNWDASIGNMVHVYDWDGNHVRDLRLDRDVFMIFASGDGKYLYARAYNKETGDTDIIRFDL